MIGAAAGGFAVTGRASVIFAGVAGSAVISNGGTEVDPIYGNPEEKANLPIPT